jgi:collagenase-like PrtC family protease
MSKKIELLSPAGSFPCLKAAIANGADAVYLGMQQFGARSYALNFNDEYLKKAVQLAHFHQVKVYLTMNTLVKNHELKSFFVQLSKAYLSGIDAVIIQDISLLDIIKQNYPGLPVHLSTQSGMLNSAQINLLKKADRIILARELTAEEIKTIKSKTDTELEVFCHGALCVSFSGSCLFSSFLGGRSGNRGKCAQPCRKRYTSSFYLSPKELCLIEKIPELIKSGISCLKVEGRMRTPSYVAKTTSIYRQAIDSYYQNNFSITLQDKNLLYSVYSRGFTEGWFSGIPKKSPDDFFNRQSSSAVSQPETKEEYFVSEPTAGSKNETMSSRKKVDFSLPSPKSSVSAAKRQLLVKVYSFSDAIAAAQSGADIIYLDIYHPDFLKAKKEIKKEYPPCKIYASTPRLMLDSDFEEIKALVKKNSPDGLLAGNVGILGLGLDHSLPIHLDYNHNIFNYLDLDYYHSKAAFPIISPELSLNELSRFPQKDFAVFVHGKVTLMTLRHSLPEITLTDERGGRFKIEKIHNGVRIINDKELGLLDKSLLLLSKGISSFYIDTDKDVSKVVSFYRSLLDDKKASSLSKKDYVLGWFFKGVE